MGEDRRLTASYPITRKPVKARHGQKHNRWISANGCCYYRLWLVQ